MAFPVVETTNFTNGTSAGTSVSVNLPSGIVAGNLLVSIHRAAGVGAIGWPAGWVELVESSADASDDVTAVAYKKADGTEGATITVTQGSFKFANVCLRISGAADPTSQAPQINTAATGTSLTPDSTSLTPTGGAKDYLWIALAAWEGESAASPLTQPSGYGTPILGNSGGAGAVTTNCRAVAATRTNNAASEDPGQWVFDPTADDWTAWTMAVHPDPNTNLAPLVGALTLVGAAGLLKFALASAVGALALVGAAPAVLQNTIITPDAGALSAVGAAPTVQAESGTFLTPPAGALALTGASVDLSQDTRITPNAGVIVLTRHTVDLIPVVAELRLTGYAPTVSITAGDLTLTPGVGTLTLAGVAPALQTPVALAPLAGALALSGVAPGVVDSGAGGTTIAPLQGSLALTGAAPPAPLGTLITASAGALSLAGVAARTDQALVSAVGALTLTGVAPSLRTAALITPAAGALALTGTAPTRLVATLTTPSAGVLALTGAAPGISKAISPPSGALILAGVAPAVVDSGAGGTNRTPLVGALTLTGQIPAVLERSLVIPSSGSLSLTGVAGHLDLAIRPGTGALTVVGATPTVVRGSSITPAVGSVTFFGTVPLLGTPTAITPATGALLLTGAPPLAVNPQFLTPGAGTLVLLGAPPAFVPLPVMILFRQPTFAIPQLTAETFAVPGCRVTNVLTVGEEA